MLPLESHRCPPTPAARSFVRTKSGFITASPDASAGSFPLRDRPAHGARLQPPQRVVFRRASRARRAFCNQDFMTSVRVPAATHRSNVTAATMVASEASLGFCAVLRRGRPSQDQAASPRACVRPRVPADRGRALFHAARLDRTSASRRQARGDSGSHRSDVDRLRLNRSNWVETVRRFGRVFKQPAGRSSSLVDAAARCSRRWFQGKAAARAAFL
jgi:hypothetical protein